MNLEIKDIIVDQWPEDPYDVSVSFRVDIGEKDKEGAETFHFVAASPQGLQNEVSGPDFKLLRGYVLMTRFDLEVVRRAIQNLINHARHQGSWDEVVAFFSRYGQYDSEDLDRSNDS
jgi:hypothetical protein